MKVHVAVIRQPNITAPIGVTYDDDPGVELTDIHPVRYRTGRKPGRTVHAQCLREPHDDDLLVGTMETPYMADLVVELLNRHLAFQAL